MRGTKKFKTKGGTEIEVYEYLTGGDARKIQQVYLEDVKVELDETGKPTMGNINPLLATKAQDRMIELLVVSVEGATDRLLERILELPSSEFDEVIATLDALQGTSEKKTS